MLGRLWRGLRRAAPPEVEAEFQRAFVHYRRGQFDLSAALLEPLAERRPDHAGVCNMLGLILARDQGRFEEGAALVRRAIRADPGLREARSNLGWILTEIGDLGGGLKCLDQLLDEMPEDHEVRLMRATANLKFGRFGAGWPDYEARHHSVTAIANPHHYPTWDGSLSPDATLLVVAEQGVGDQIMFASCLSETRERVGSMVIECHPHLVPLLQRAFPHDCVGARDQAQPLNAWAGSEAIDLQIPFGSLPQFFRNTLNDFPRHSGYLTADPERVRYWAQRLQALGPGLKVGLSWRGGTINSRRSLRSIEPESLAPLLGLPVHFINLQYGSTEPDRAALSDMWTGKFVHWPDALESYDETAALVVALDLVVSVCTAVIHLAGALGRPVWVLTPAAPEWRYGAAGATLPWYPSARLFRQVRAFEWGEVVERAALALAEIPRPAGT
jgi:tetratricopeptide (TPR) repeat protein